MNSEEFFNLLEKEIQTNQALKDYYRFNNSHLFYNFRKAYFCQRLDYLMEQIKKPDAVIWDCGCGYGTISLFLAMNGIRSHGTTIGDNYYNAIANRLEFWKDYGDVSLFTFSYENLFDSTHPSETYDHIVLQDTLHHLEPVNEVFNIFYNTLKPDGNVIILEANGSNLVYNIMLFLQRGNKKIIERYDEQLKKIVLYGNENFRTLEEWQKILKQENFALGQNVQYIKFLPPIFYNGKNVKELRNLEQIISKNIPLLRKYFFFGLNFVANKI